MALINELVQMGRDLIYNQFGKAFADKATDEFCSNFASKKTNVGFRGGIAEAAGPAENKNIIVEFTADDSRDDQLELLRDIPEHHLRSIEESIGEPTRQAKAVLNKVRKNSRIKAKKESSTRRIQTVQSQLEKKIEQSFINKKRSFEDRSFITKYCWLNQTLKTEEDEDSLAEIASESTINRIDVPRRLVREINQTRSGIFAQQYSQRFNRQGLGVSIAIIDSEVDFEHPALAGRIFKAENYTSEPWGTPDFHGTAVAGIIGSADPGAMGMAPQVKMYNYKVLGTRISVSADDFDGIKAIEKALEDDMQIANCSWGIEKVGTTSSREARACDEAWNLGLTIVKSAGNKGPGASTLTTPAEAEGIIVVGACSKDGSAVEDYSSRGPIHSGKVRPHLLAPGGSPNDGIFSCLTTRTMGPSGYGTSYAAPHVTGLLALILEEQPDLSNDDLRDFAIRLSTVLQGFNSSDQGNGVISLRSLLV